MKEEPFYKLTGQEHALPTPLFFLNTNPQLFVKLHNLHILPVHDNCHSKLFLQNLQSTIIFLLMQCSKQFLSSCLQVASSHFTAGVCRVEYEGEASGDGATQQHLTHTGESDKPRPPK